MSQSRLFYASQSLMILARDFDTQEIASIESSLKDIAAAIWGHNSVGLQHNAEIALFASLLYYLCLLRSEGNTVGQDYCNLDMKLWKSSGYFTSLPPVRKSVLFLLLALYPYIATRGSTYLTSLCGASTASVIEMMMSVAEDLHLSAFYFVGRYLEPAYRTCSVRLATDKIPQHRQKQLKVLSYLIGLRCLLTCGRLIRHAYALSQSNASADISPPRDRSFSRAYYSETFERAAEESLQSARQSYCSLCMERGMKQPTTTKCGHVFCWECITHWLVKQPRCPVCRNAQLPQQLRVLHNY